MLPSTQIKKNMELLQHLYYHKLPNSTLKYHPSIPQPSIDFISALNSQWIPLAGGMTARKQEATAPSCREKPQKTWARSSFTHHDTSRAATRQIHLSKYSIHWYRVSTGIIWKMDSCHLQKKNLTQKTFEGASTAELITYAEKKQLDGKRRRGSGTTLRGTTSPIKKYFLLTSLPPCPPGSIM